MATEQKPENVESPCGKSLELNWYLAEVMGFAGGDVRLLPTPIFKFYRVWSWIGIVVVISFSAVFLSDPTIEPEELSKTLVITIGVTMLFVTKISISTNKDRLGVMFNRSHRIYNELAQYEENWPDLQAADRKSTRLIKIMGLFFLPHIPLSAVQAGVKMWLSGEPAYPFQMATFGFPIALSWIIQLTTILQPILFVWSHHALLKIIVIQMSSYTSVLVRLLRERPVHEDKAHDRRIFQLLNDLYMLSADISSLNGLGAAIELAAAPARSCFASYHLQLAVKMRKFNSAFIVVMTFVTCLATSCSYCISGEEVAIQHERILEGISNSEWYKCPSSARKPIIQLLTLSKTPMNMHYRRIVPLKIEQISNVMQTTYTLATALANFL